jgi:hypothetical protein
MADDGSGWWSWLADYFTTPAPILARTPPVRRNTISKAPPDHFTPAAFYYSAPGPLPVPLRQRKETKFYHKGQPYYEFTNFAPYDIIHKGKRYPTSEHLFQAFKVRLVGFDYGSLLTVFIVFEAPPANLRAYQSLWQ